MALLLSFFFLVAHAEERWPPHQGHIVEDVDAKVYLENTLHKESQPLGSWLNTDEHATDVCGVLFQISLQQRSGGVYVVAVLRSGDKKKHVVKWSPVGYRFDGSSFRKLTPFKAVTEIRPVYEYLYSMPFTNSEQLKDHQTMQLYLPWIEGCAAKSYIDFVNVSGT